MKRSGSLDVEILRSRLAIKAWAVRRIALTPVASDEEREASEWFHELTVDDRSKVFTDLARLSLEGADLKGIARGPLGELLRRYPEVFKACTALDQPTEYCEDPSGEMAIPVGVMGPRAWTGEWQEFEPELEDVIYSGS